MGLMLNKLKLRAAAGSMHQFCPAVRAIFPGPADDALVESATLYLYVKTSRVIFGKRFAGRLHRRLREQLKFGTPREIESIIARIMRKARRLRQAADSLVPGRSTEAEFHNHVASVVEAMISEAQPSLDDDAGTRGNIYASFEIAARRIRDHLAGIKGQHRFVMK